MTYNVFGGTLSLRPTHSSQRLSNALQRGNAETPTPGPILFHLDFCVILLQSV